jgi:hypothetical protein
MSKLDRRYQPLANRRRAGDVADVTAVDTEIVQFARGHTTEFRDRLTVFAPVVERACYVHDDPLPWAFEAELPSVALHSLR